MKKLLLIDDDIDILKLNQKFLSAEGYEVRVLDNPKETLKLLKSYHPDCIILDIMMPGVNGFVLCSQIRSVMNVPFVFLSGRTTEEFRLKGFQLGADDFITKPYSLKELSARIKVILRRNNKQKNSLDILSYPPLKLDLRLHKAYSEDEEIPLSNREYDLLYHLMSHPNQTITFENLGNAIWGSYYSTDRKTIMVTASRLRKKLSLFVGLDNIITTVWSKGYQFSMKRTQNANESI